MILVSYTRANIQSNNNTNRHNSEIDFILILLKDLIIKSTIRI